MKLNEVLKEIVGNNYKENKAWVSNAYAHVVWKMSAYGLQLKQNEEEFLNAKNIMHHIYNLYLAEFEETKRSFF